MTTAIENLQSAQAHAASIRPKAGGFPVLAKVWCLSRSWKFRSTP